MNNSTDTGLIPTSFQIGLDTDTMIFLGVVVIVLVSGKAIFR